MRLPDFIRTNLGPLLDRWVEFAATILPAHELNNSGLADHARDMLLAIVADLSRAQSDSERMGRTKGIGLAHGERTAAEQHGSGRLAAGFSINETVSEHRALRASVIELWTTANPTMQPGDREDLVRFNEAIDQALAESLDSYTTEKEMQTRLLETIMAVSPDHIYVLDPDGRFRYINNAKAQLYGLAPEAMVGKTYFELGMPFAHDMEQQLRQAIDTREPSRGELSYPRGAGAGLRFEYILAPVIGEDNQVEAIVGLARDITKRKSVEEESWRNANFDFLTGLPNRRLFRDRLEQDVKHAERTGLPFALLFIDLDRFKEVNDLLGHDAGDMLLHEAAVRIQARVRAADTIARLGGDEFTVVLTELTDVGHVAVTAQELIDELARPFPLLQDMAHISASIGITIFPQDATTPENLVRNADQAMYVAKSAGRNRYCYFTPTVQGAALARLRLAGDLRGALAEQQLDVYYQPIVELAAGRIVGAEALLRWHHPQLGLVLPAEFIGLAEETGFIVEIGNWVFTEAAALAKRWSELAGAPFQVSINKSPLQFVHAGSSMNWGAHLNSLGLAAHSMSVEVTEGVLFMSSASAADKLAGLREAGIDLSIDDFGTGYSSMAYLKKFAVDFLKIDQSFVQGMETDAGSRTIAETIIVMAHKLGLKVVAEGVETAPQRDWLAQAGCDYAQGFLFSPAVPADQFERLLMRRQPASGA
jgi:diguanylate cyclase (GGDEF)-like protein/PAS domain S-box-containing protein